MVILGIFLSCMLFCVCNLVCVYKDEQWSKIALKRIKNIRKVDLWHERDMLEKLHNMMAEGEDIRQELNFFIENNARQLKYLDNKKEPSVVDFPDNSE